MRYIFIFIAFIFLTSSMSFAWTSDMDSNDPNRIIMNSPTFNKDYYEESLGMPAPYGNDEDDSNSSTKYGNDTGDYNPYFDRDGNLKKEELFN